MTLLRQESVMLGLGLVMLMIAGCTASQQSVTGGSTICQDIAAVTSNPTVVQILGAQPPTSSIGVLWADVQVACPGATPAPGVSSDWIGLVFGELKALAPSVLPVLIGLL